MLRAATHLNKAQLPKQSAQFPSLAKSRKHSSFGQKEKTPQATMNQQTGGQQDRQDKNNNENKSNTQIRKYFWPLFGHSPIDTLLWPHLEMFN